MSLSGSQHKALRDAILSGFTRPDLEQLAKFRFDVKLAAIVPPDATFEYLVFQLIAWVENHGRTDELIRSIGEERPTHATIQQAVADLLSPPRPSAAPAPAPAGGVKPSISGYGAFVEDMIATGGVFHLDPWKAARSPEEREFKQLLKGKREESIDLMRAERYATVVELWAPLDGNPYFRVDHPEWAMRPYFRSRIHAAKMMLFMACAQLGMVVDCEVYVPKAFNALTEVLKGNPYSMQGGADDRLAAEDAMDQNLNYRDTLEFARTWFNAWGSLLETMFGIAKESWEAARERVGQRRYEIDFILHARGVNE